MHKITQPSKAKTYIIIGGAVITQPPLDTNKTEGDMVNFQCKGVGEPGMIIFVVIGN